MICIGSETKEETLYLKYYAYGWSIPTIPRPLFYYIHLVNHGDRSDIVLELFTLHYINENTKVLVSNLLQRIVLPVRRNRSYLGKVIQTQHARFRTHSPSQELSYSSSH